MRKLVILSMAIGVSLCLAGVEQWIGPDPCHEYAIPNPESGIFSEEPGVFWSVVDTFGYDDNIGINAWAYNYGGQGWGVKFVSPSDNITLAGALINFYSGWPTPGGDDAQVKVFADDGPDGSPGTEIWSSDTLTITRGQWNYIPINTSVVGSNYYVFYVQVDSYPMCPALTIDAIDNAPSHRKWSYSATDGFAEDARVGDWLIRAVVDWDPQDTNAASLYFATNMPKDTLPGVNFSVRTMVGNSGNDDLPAGTPVRLHITGPQSYTYDDTAVTAAALAHGQSAQVAFTPPWPIPAASGEYVINAWTEAPGDEYLGNDTIIYDLSVAKWVEYGDFNQPQWLMWGTPERATKFDPTAFGLAYPVGIGRARHQFYYHSSYPWPDSTFYFKVYANDGQTLLYQSEALEAPPGAPGAVIAADFDSTVIIESGEFYIAIAPVSSSGHPSSLADNASDGRSFVGSAGSWSSWSNGELLISASCQSGATGMAEGNVSPVHEPVIRISNYPNPVSDVVTIKWQVPRMEPVNVNLYDATGRLVRNLYSSSAGLIGTVTLDARQFASGVYLVRLEADGEAATHKLILEH